MTGFRDMSRIKKIWDRSIQYFRRAGSQDSNELDKHTANAVAISQPLWRRKSVLIISGAAILLTASGILGYQQYTKYIENNTFDFYHVYRNGTIVGTVSDPEKVETLIAKKSEEVQQAHPDVHMVLDAGEITYERESAFKPEPETEATLAKLDSMFTSHAVGVEVKIDNKVIGIVKDQETADEILLRVQSKYAPELVAASKNVKSVTTLSYSDNDEEAAADSKEEEKAPVPGTQVTEVEFVEKVEIENSNVDPEQIDEPEAIYKRIVEGSTKPTKYVVQAGDCIGCIAQKFDISPQVIYENNSWIEGDRITVGDELDLTVLQPELTVRTVENLVEIEKIAPPLEVRKNNDMRVGQSKTISEGKEGSQRLTYRIEKQNGYVVTEELVNKEVLTEALPKIVEQGTLVVKGEGSGKFAMPVTNARITSKFGKRWGRMHNGVDFTGNKTILASDAGTVEFVGTKSGLGNTIIINHKNGYKTVYGHLSSYKVKKGEKVEKGDAIAIMGNTGNSTGTHLHFEVHKNGTPQNPLSYL